MRTTMKLLASCLLVIGWSGMWSCGQADAQKPHPVQLNWTASVVPPPLVGYYVYRAKQGQTFTRLTSQPLSTVSYLDQTVQKKTTYNYYVTAVNSAGQESPHSNMITVKIPNP